MELNVHTHDEELRAFLSEERRRKLAQAADLPQPRVVVEVSEAERNAPHEFNGFGD